MPPCGITRPQQVKEQYCYDIANFLQNTHLSVVKTMSMVYGTAKYLVQIKSNFISENKPKPIK